MAVKESQRGLSRLEFYHTAIKLRRDITLLLLRDFGVKDKVRNVNLLAKMYELSEEDAQALKSTMDKYGMSTVTEEYPEWLISDFRRGIMQILRALVMNITAANTIYPYLESEFYERRNYQNRAIGNCEQLLQEMQYVMGVLPVNAEKLMPYVETIEKEIALLKGWRKSDNKILRQIKKKQREEQKKEEQPQEETHRS